MLDLLQSQRIPLLCRPPDLFKATHVQKMSLKPIKSVVGRLGILLNTRSLFEAILDMLQAFEEIRAEFRKYDDGRKAGFEAYH